MRIFHGKILLMVPHYGDQDFFGQHQELRIESTQDSGRKLREIDHCIEKRLVLAPACPSYGASRRIQSLANLPFALGAAQYLCSAQRIHIRGARSRYGDYRIRQNAVTMGILPCPDAVELEWDSLPI